MRKKPSLSRLKDNGMTLMQYARERFAPSFFVRVECLFVRLQREEGYSFSDQTSIKAYFFSLGSVRIAIPSTRL